MLGLAASTAIALHVAALGQRLGWDRTHATLELIAAIALSIALMILGAAKGRRLLPIGIGQL